MAIPGWNCCSLGVDEALINDVCDNHDVTKRIQDPNVQHHMGSQYAEHVHVKSLADNFGKEIVEVPELQ